MKAEVFATKDNTHIAVIPSSSTKEQRKILLKVEAKMFKVREITGNSWEDIMQKHHQIMGWEPYKSF